MGLRITRRMLSLIVQAPILGNASIIQITSILIYTSVSRYTIVRITRRQRDMDCMVSMCPDNDTSGKKVASVAFDSDRLFFSHFLISQKTFCVS